MTLYAAGMLSTYAYEERSRATVRLGYKWAAVECLFGYIRL